MARNKKVAIIAVVIVLIAGAVTAYIRGRSLWHPIYVKITGGRSIQDAVGEIEKHMPELKDFDHKKINIIVYKEERVVKVVDQKVLCEFEMTAYSGNLGPKTGRGDGQIPEGIYRIVSLNPNSSYHLSLKISYPNKVDLERCRRRNVADPGDDIYIHGKNTSDGCIAIGDRAIEMLFYMVNKAGKDNVKVIIVPSECYKHEYGESPNRELYDSIYHEVNATLHFAQ
jgi:murein L,D-transpeptidase YafK